MGAVTPHLRVSGVLAAAAAAFVVGATVLAPTVLAAGEVQFGAIQAVSTFATGISVSEPVTLPAGVKRVEIVIRTEGDDGSDVADVTPAAGSTANLHYELGISPGQVIPNTLLHVRFRVTLADGTLEPGPETSVRYSDTRFDWKTLSGDIVRVHWVEGDEAFGRRALAIGDKAVADASALLGVTETEPVDFFVYPDPNSFRDVLGPATRENVGGVAFPGIRTLLTNITPDQVNAAWVAIVVPHELTHLVFGTATDNPYHSPPHWMNEGLAVYLSQGFDSDDRNGVTGAVRDGSLMPLPSLDGQFPTAGDRFGLAYSESVSAIDFMVRKYGKDALVGLIRSYAQGRTDDEAFKAALGVDVEGFEAAWLADIGAPAPSPFGPQPAPAGNLPADWGGAAGSGGAAPSGGTAAGPVTSEAPATSGSPSINLMPLAVGGVIVVLVLVGVVVLATRNGPAPPPPPRAP
jgi:Peptidase MA superfamily